MVEEINKYLKEYEIKCIDEKYKNANLGLSLICKKNHKFIFSWDLIKRLKIVKCPICFPEFYKDIKINSIYLDMYKVNTVNNSSLIHQFDGKTFFSERKMNKHIRDLKRKTSQHEIAIQNIIKNYKGVKQYKFAENVLKTMALLDLPKIYNFLSLKEKNKKIREPCCLMCGPGCFTSENYNKCDYKDKELTTLIDYIKNNFEEPLRRIMPDAYYIDTENHIINVIEVEDQNRISFLKLLNFVDLWMCFDCDDTWVFKVLVFDRFSNCLGYLNLSFYYYVYIKYSFKKETELDLNLFKSIANSLELKSIEKDFIDHGITSNCFNTDIIYSFHNTINKRY